MLRISIVFLHVISVLSQSSSSDYYDKDEADEGRDMETIFRYAKNEHPKQSGLPVAYLYMATNPNPPAEKQCITCLYELYQKEGSKIDACKCLPCWIHTSKDEAAQKFVIGLFERRFCGEVKHRKRAKLRKEPIDEEIDYSGGKAGRKKFRMESGTNVKNVKYVEDYFYDPDKSEQSSRAVKPKMNRVQLRADKNSRSSDDTEICLGEDCGVGEPIKALRDESHDIVKEKVRKVFNDVLTRMERINKANEEKKETEKPTDTTIRNRWLKKQRSEEKPKPVQRYRNQYQRPSYRVASPPRRDDSNRRRSENTDDPVVHKEDVEVKPKGRRNEETTESKIPKSSKSKDRKSKIAKNVKSDDVPETIPDNISVGSLTFEDPITIHDDKEVNDDDQINDDRFTSDKDLAETEDKDYSIHFDDEEPEKKPRKHRKLKGTTGTNQETRNTPSDMDENRARTTATPFIEIHRSGMRKTTPCNLRNSKNRLRSSKTSATTEESTSKLTVEENLRTESSEEVMTTTEANNRMKSNTEEEEIKDEVENEAQEEGEEEEQDDEDEEEEEEGGGELRSEGTEEEGEGEEKGKDEDQGGGEEREDEGEEKERAEGERRGVGEEEDDDEEETTETTEESSAQESEMDSENLSGKTSPMSEESTTVPSSHALVLKFTDGRRSIGRLQTSAESITEATIRPENISTVESSNDRSYESATETSGSPSNPQGISTDSSETTIKFGRKFTRSTNPTAYTDGSGSNDESDEKTTGATESTKSDRFLRQTDCNDLKLEINGETKTTEPVETRNQRSGDDDRNVTQLQNPRYIIELEEDPEVSNKSWSPEDPILKVKMNIYSASKQGNVYNFLSKLIPKNRNSEESKNGLQIEASFRKGQPKTLSLRNIEKLKRRGD